jgi:CheY-like chemotaxis protein
VLVAEDNTVNALLLEEALGASGYKFYTPKMAAKPFQWL